MPLIQRGNSELYYEVHGEGPPVVFAHGVGGNHAIWHKQIPEFARHHTVITFDHRGFGNSTDAEGLGRGGFIADLEALLDHLGIERASVVGQSMGGGTCVCFTYQHPHRVASLVIADSLHGFEEPDDVADIMARARKETASLSQPERVLGQNIRTSDPVAAVLYSALNSFNATDRSNLTGSYGPKCTPEQLAATGVPILFIGGREDVLFPFDAISLMRARCDGAALIGLEATGHSAFYENPRDFNQAVLSFLGNVNAGTPTQKVDS